MPTLIYITMHNLNHNQTIGKTPFDHLIRLSRIESIRLHLTVSDAIDRQVDLYFRNRAI